jgi:hypothetical protein
VLMWDGIMGQKVSGATVMVCIWRLWWFNMQNKTNTCDMARQHCISHSKRPKMETTQTRTCQFYLKIAICINAKIEWNVSLVLHSYSTRHWQLKSGSKWSVQMTWRNRGFFFRPKDLTLQEVTIFMAFLTKFLCISLCHSITQPMM